MSEQIIDVVTLRDNGVSKSDEKMAELAYTLWLARSGSPESDLPVFVQEMKMKMLAGRHKRRSDA